MASRQRGFRRRVLQQHLGGQDFPIRKSSVDRCISFQLTLFVALPDAFLRERVRV